MLFNSFEFVVFIILFYIFWSFFKQKRHYILVCFSLVFYGWWDARFIILILLSSFVDYFTSLHIEKSNSQTKRKVSLLISIAVNLFILFFFKYAIFLLESLNQFIGVLGIKFIFETHYHITLPVGISFYTFQSMSYTIDVYKKKLHATKNFLKFFSYISMFPQLVAGPIVRAKDLLGQMNNLENKNVSESEMMAALLLCIRGFIKKMVFADNLAPFIDNAFVVHGYAVSSLDWVLIMIGFSLQIYFDFSGYSDIAIGLARSMGLKFKDNFNHPYIAKSLTEFWQRWHISLSSWFRDYVYIPLGGNRVGAFRTHLNILITFFLSGLWHGASWNFCVWGIFHGLVLIFEKILPKNRLSSFSFFNWGTTMLLVLIGWVFFRAVSLGQALEVLRSLGHLTMSLNLSGYFILIIIGGILFETGSVLIKRMNRPVLFFRRSEFIALVVFLLIILRGKGQDFIYFQF